MTSVDSGLKVLRGELGKELSGSVVNISEQATGATGPARQNAVTLACVFCGATGIATNSASRVATGTASGVTTGLVSGQAGVGTGQAGAVADPWARGDAWGTGDQAKQGASGQFQQA